MRRFNIGSTDSLRDSKTAPLIVAKQTLAWLEEKPLATVRKRLSGELLGLTCGCDRWKEGSQKTSQEDNPNISGFINPEVRSQPPHCV
jgi:hypothetical protein